MSYYFSVFSAFSEAKSHPLSYFSILFHVCSDCLDSPNLSDSALNVITEPETWNVRITNVRSFKISSFSFNEQNLGLCPHPPSTLAPTGYNFVCQRRQFAFPWAYLVCLIPWAWSTLVSCSPRQQRSTLAWFSNCCWLDRSTLCRSRLRIWGKCLCLIFVLIVLFNMVTKQNIYLIKI